MTELVADPTALPVPGEVEGPHADAGDTIIPLSPGASHVRRVDQLRHCTVDAVAQRGPRAGERRAAVCAGIGRAQRH